MNERNLKCNSCPFITKYQRGKTWLYNNRAPGCVLLLLVGIQNRFVCGLVITVITRMLRLLLLANSFPHPHTQKGTIKKPTYTTITMKISYIHIQFPSILSHKKKASFVFFPFGLCWACWWLIVLSISKTTPSLDQTDVGKHKIKIGSNRDSGRRGWSTVSNGAFVSPIK